MPAGMRLKMLRFRVSRLFALRRVSGLRHGAWARADCADNAAALSRRADDLGWDVDLRTIGPTSPE